MLAIVERLVLGSLFSFVDSTAVAVARWARSRGWFWQAAMRLASGRFQSMGGAVGILYNETAADDVSEDGEESRGEKTLGETPTDEETETVAVVEEAMEEHISGGLACMAIILAPFVIFSIMIFPNETRIPQQYQIRHGDLSGCRKAHTVIPGDLSVGGGAPAHRSSSGTCTFDF